MPLEHPMLSSRAASPARSAELERGRHVRLNPQMPLWNEILSLSPPSNGSGFKPKEGQSGPMTDFL